MRKLRTLLIVLLIFSFATRVYAQVSTSHSPSAPQRIPTPAATTSPDKSAISLAELAQKPEIVTRLEIFLDQHSFSPGKIDGHWGDFCVKALQRYELAHGQQMANQLDPAIQRELSQISPLYIDYQLTADDFRHVGKAPNRPAEQARVKSMPYRSILDFVASDIILMRRLSGS